MGALNRFIHHDLSTNVVGRGFTPRRRAVKARPTVIESGSDQSVYGWWRCTGGVRARTRRLIISTNTEKNIAK
jgi:hypothetical protein